MVRQPIHLRKNDCNHSVMSNSFNAARASITRHPGKPAFAMGHSQAYAQAPAIRRK